MIENEVTWPGEHITVQVGDLVKYDNGSVLRVTKVYPDNWGCDAVDVQTGRACALYQWSLDVAKVSRPHED